VYCTPLAASAEGVMRRIDELHLAFPVGGSRKLHNLPAQNGISVGRKHP
jgi:hypothetical protein